MRTPPVLFVSTLLCSLPLIAGGGSFTSTQNGPWSDASTWGGTGVPQQFNFATANHVVTVSSSGATVSSVRVGGELRIVSGDLTTQEISVGKNQNGRVTVEGGTLHVNTLTRVGVDDTGTLSLKNAGVLTTHSLDLGVDGHQVTLNLLGDNHSLTVAGTTTFGADSFVNVSPAYSGLQGVAPMHLHDVVFQPGAILGIESGTYLNGESTVLFTYTGTIQGGGFTNIVTGATGTFALDDSEPGVVRIEVVDGFTPWFDEGSGLAGSDGEPLLRGYGDLVPGSSDNVLFVERAAPSAFAGLFVGTESNPVAFKGGTLQVFPFIALLDLTTDVDGEAFVPFALPLDATPGLEFWCQLAVQDAGAPKGIALSNAVRAVVP